MARPSNRDWFFALLTAGSFLAMLSTGIFAFLDAIDGRPWYAYEFVLAAVCGTSFASLLLTQEALRESPAIVRGNADDIR